MRELTGFVLFVPEQKTLHGPCLLHSTSVKLVYSYTFSKIARKLFSKICLELAFTCTFEADHGRRRPSQRDDPSGGQGHGTFNCLSHFSSSDAWSSSRLRNRAGRGIRSRNSTWPRWLLRAMKITTIARGDDQRVGRRRSPRSFRRCGYRLMLLNYKDDN